MTPEEFWAILNAPVEVAPIFYRAYYDNNRIVTLYTMEDLPGSYIDVDQTTYVRAPYARIVNGQLVEIKPAKIVKKLVPGISGNCCDPGDVCVIINKEPNTKWSIKIYEQD